MSPFRSRRRRPSSSYEDWNKGPRRRWRPRSRARGCLLWLLILIVVLVVLALVSGGFQKGTKSSGLGGPASPSGSVSVSMPC